MVNTFIANHISNIITVAAICQFFYSKDHADAFRSKDALSGAQVVA